MQYKASRKRHSRRSRPLTLWTRILLLRQVTAHGYVCLRWSRGVRVSDGKPSPIIGPITHLDWILCVDLLQALHVCSYTFAELYHVPVDFHILIPTRLGRAAHNSSGQSKIAGSELHLPSVANTCSTSSFSAETWNVRFKCTKLGKNCKSLSGGLEVIYGTSEKFLSGKSSLENHIHRL